MSLLYLVFLLGSLQWICVRPETVEIGVEGDASYYDIDDDDVDFDVDDFERRLMDFGIDLEGDDYVFVSFANSRVYPPINAESEWETRVNGDSIRRSLMGGSDAPKKGDKWLEVDHIDSVMGQYNGDDGVFIRHSAMEAALDTDIDLETFPNRRLISIDSSLVTKRCDDNSCDYSVDMSPFHRVLESKSDDIPNEVILDSSDVMPQCNQLDCNIMVDRRLSVGKMNIGPMVEGMFRSGVVNAGSNLKAKFKRVFGKKSENEGDQQDETQEPQPATGDPMDEEGTKNQIQK